MGMYTELLLKCTLRKDLPPDVEAVLQHLFNGADCPAVLPAHDVFTHERWRQIGTNSTYYHIPWESSRYHEGYLFTRSDIKNYSGTLEMFVEWLRPYIDGQPEQVIGWTWYEENNAPTLLLRGPQ